MAKLTKKQQRELEDIVEVFKEAKQFRHEKPNDVHDRVLLSTGINHLHVFLKENT